MTGIEMVKAELLERGVISAKEAIYEFTEPDGRVHRITRLAAIIHTLRHRDGWDIQTKVAPGYLAVYVLHGLPDGSRPKPPNTPKETIVVPDELPVPEKAWRCSACKVRTYLPVLEGLDQRYATGHCATCHKRRLFFVR